MLNIDEVGRILATLSVESPDQRPGTDIKSDKGIKKSSQYPVGTLHRSAISPPAQERIDSRDEHKEG